MSTPLAANECRRQVRYDYTKDERIANEDLDTATIFAGIRPVGKVTITHEPVIPQSSAEGEGQGREANAT